MITLSLAMNGCAFAQVSISVWEQNHWRRYQCRLKNSLLIKDGLWKRYYWSRIMQFMHYHINFRWKQPIPRVNWLRHSRTTIMLHFSYMKVAPLKRQLLMLRTKKWPLESWDGVLYSCWAAILQLQQGLCDLNVLDIIKDNLDLMKSFFCYNPPDLSSIMLTLNLLFTIMGIDWWFTTHRTSYRHLSTML